MLDAGEMGFTFCQVPIVLRRGEQASIVVCDRDQGEIMLNGDVLPQDISHGIYEAGSCGAFDGHDSSLGSTSAASGGEIAV